jgi:hypothetical protein
MVNKATESRTSPASLTNSSPLMPASSKNRLSLLRLKVHELPTKTCTHSADELYTKKVYANVQYANSY